MTARFPRYGSRFASRCLALVLALVLAVGPVASVQAVEGSFGGEYYHSGNAVFGDFGGYGFNPGNNYGGRLIEAGIEGGGGIDLGCGAINIMDYMKATFNVNNLIERAKASMQTMVAKYIMVFLLSQPIIASAMDKLNGMLNFGYDLFNQSCDLGEIQKLAKARYTRECIKDKKAEGEPHGAAVVMCQNMEDPLKPMMNQAAAVLGEDLQRVLSDPIGSLQASMGCSASGTRTETYGGETVEIAQNNLCLLMAFAPRVCGNMEFGGGSSDGRFGGRPMDGCNTFESPISGAGVSGYAMRGTGVTMQKSAQVWDSIRQANPRSTVADLKIISANAITMANLRATPGEVSSLGKASTPRNQLAMTNITKVTQMFGNGGSENSEKMLNEYRESSAGLKGCSEENRTNPLRMVQFVARAANEHFGSVGGVSIDDNIQFTDAEKLKAEEFFNFNAIPEEVQKKMGIDAKSAVTMLEETVSCLTNGQTGMDEAIPVTNPVLGFHLATGTCINVGGTCQVMDWQTASRWMGRPMSCKSVNKVFTYLITKFKDAKNNLALNDKTALPGTDVKNSDGTVTTKSSKMVDTEEVKDILGPALDKVILQFQATLDANASACVGFTSTGIKF